LGTDRWRLRRVPGLRFVRVLGTGRGARTSFSFNPCRTALFAVWEDAGWLDEFLAASPVARRWRQAQECFSVRLRALDGFGAWGGFDVLDAVAPARGGPSGLADPVAVLTRANVRLAHWPAFFRAARRVSAGLAGVPDLLAVVGIGEAPVGRQATFSLWSSAADVDAFLRGHAEHREVVRRTRTERWYGEELFARFEPFQAEGTWDGRRPLGDLSRPAR
jgi:hypothetical protein